MKTLKLYVILWALASLLLSCDSSSDNSNECEQDNIDDAMADNYECILWV
ncbi:hypothetical protein KEM09_14120 [Carboxylicivirga mesophila]|uniref:Lipoprotein n=1 Tax=Carboxylicivirga mesophila TaxID=1166478 RepID=A0ABS5KBY7_9BACT|nr:hypothetical protein [Carboxylicivirga mesophila]MBS2212549.1 hypothetical protein [Carboxylicivirga mesophila]